MEDKQKQKTATEQYFVQEEAKDPLSLRSPYLILPNLFKRVVSIFTTKRRNSRRLRWSTKNCKR
ncbi:unnamed protein product [Arabidopsis lyrata]|nr:unnamed protein product [Arabidopsis lyrata]